MAWGEGRVAGERGLGGRRARGAEPQLVETFAEAILEGHGGRERGAFRLPAGRHVRKGFRSTQQTGRLPVVDLAKQLLPHEGVDEVQRGAAVVGRRERGAGGGGRCWPSQRCGGLGASKESGGAERGEAAETVLDKRERIDD